MEFRILTATPGSNKERIAEKLRTFIANQSVEGRPARVGFGFVEDQLCEICPSDLYTLDPNQDRVLLILAQLPQEKIRDLWMRAFDLAVQDARRPQDGHEPDVAVVVTSLSYYRKQTYEFYCPVDLKSMAERQSGKDFAENGAILTLIDDIFDVYNRLCQDGHVFSIQRLVETELRKNSGAEIERYKKAMALVIQCLVRILEWRESEIQAADSLAATLGWSRSVLAIKHPVETGARILLGSATSLLAMGSSLPVYLSHPISVPRRQNAKTGQWPSFVAEFDDFIHRVRECSGRNIHIVPVMPTAIDEYRFLKDGDRLLPRLAPRWPLPTVRDSDNDGLMYSGSEAYTNYEEYEEQCLQEIFNPPLDNESRKVSLPNSNERIAGILMGDPEISGMLRTLESVIRLQMANRDHLLVRQCPGFLLYRPTFEDPPRFTGGVLAEIRDQHFHRRFDERKLGYGRPMAFVHSNGDLQRMFQLDGPFVKDAKSPITQKAREILAAHEHSRVGDVPDEILVKAMANPGDPDAQVSAVHAALFPPDIGSISMTDPPSLEATQSDLRNALLETRVQCLCVHDPQVGWEWRYYAIGDGGQCIFEHSGLTEETCPIMLAAVVKDLEIDDQQRAATASLVHQHFADRFSPP